jgi:membrane-associated phospholipid phosphatase
MAVPDSLKTPTREIAPPPRGPSLWVLATTGASFTALAVFAHLWPILPFDFAITQAVQAVQAPWFHGLLRPFNQLGFPPVVDIIYGSVTLIIFLRGRRWAAASCAFSGIGTAALNFITKAIVARPRPPMEMVHVEHQIANSTFPAGHVLNFTPFAGFLAYLALARLAPSWRRTALVTMLAVAIALMGVARIDSGEHWTSDVLGGYLLGSLWLTATIWFYRWGERRFVMPARHDDARSSDKSRAG